MTDDLEPDAIPDDMLDGNVAAGLLASVFGADMTAIPGRCAHCGEMHVIGELRAYVHAPGTILRCPACGGVILRVVETPTATYIDARGAAFLRFDRR